MIFSINQGKFPLFYVMTLASFILNIVAFLFLWFYIFDSKKFSLHFISLLLIARIIVDILGHSYEFITIKSLYYQLETDATLTAINLIAWMIPSYIAMIDYIFQKNKSI